jgi:hypothetical protein
MKLLCLVRDPFSNPRTFWCRFNRILKTYQWIAEYADIRHQKVVGYSTFVNMIKTVRTTPIYLINESDLEILVYKNTSPYNPNLWGSELNPDKTLFVMKRTLEPCEKSFVQNNLTWVTQPYRWVIIDNVFYNWDYSPDYTKLLWTESEVFVGACKGGKIVDFPEPV